MGKPQRLSSREAYMTIYNPNWKSEWGKGQGFDLLNLRVKKLELSESFNGY